MRISRTEQAMRIAEVISLRGTCGRLQVGCVITVNGRIVTTGYNGPPAGAPHCQAPYCDQSKSCLRALHAEVNAIGFAAAEGLSLRGGTLYCTYAPCEKCAQLIKASGIAMVYYRHPFRDMDGVEYLENHGVPVSQLTERDGEEEPIQDNQQTV